MRKLFYIKPEFDLYAILATERKFDTFSTGGFVHYCYGPFSRKKVLEICEKEFDENHEYIFLKDVFIIREENYNNVPLMPSFYKQWSGEESNDEILNLVEL